VDKWLSETQDIYAALSFNYKLSLARCITFKTVAVTKAEGEAKTDLKDLASEIKAIPYDKVLDTVNTKIGELLGAINTKAADTRQAKQQKRVEAPSQAQTMSAIKLIDKKELKEMLSRLEKSEKEIKKAKETLAKAITRATDVLTKAAISIEKTAADIKSELENRAG
jgi:hypothetical protein